MFHGTEFRYVFSSTEWFGTKFQRVLLQFCSTVQNSEHFCLPRNGFGTEFRDFCVPGKRRNSVRINQLFRLFRLPRNNFFVGNCQPYSRCSSGPHGEDTSLKTESKNSGKDVIQNFFQKKILKFSFENINFVTNYFIYFNIN
jgi:hypothetical protein